MSRCFKRPDARAIVKGSEEYPGIHGEVLFFQERGATLVNVRVYDLPWNDSGFYGFHIHEGADCCGEGFQNTRGHLNPENRPHPSHMGDLPPLLACHSNAFMTVRTDRFQVREIIGRTVIVHFGADDFHTQPSGDAGNKIACGLICAE